jgi:hypothetical protein
VAEQIAAWLEAFLAQRGDDLLTLGGVLGVLIGSISFLFHALIAAKDNQLKEVRAHLAETILDRDFWRDVALGVARPSDKATWLDTRAAQAAQRQAEPLKPVD